MTDEQQHQLKMSGEQRGIHENIVRAAISKFSSGLKPINPSDLDRLIAQAKHISNKIGVEFLTSEQEKVLITARDPQYVANHLTKEYLHHFNTFSKDELLFIITLFLVEGAVFNLCGTTDNVQRIIV